MSSGHSIRAIAEMTGLARNTVRCVLREPAPHPAKRRGRSSRLDPYKPYLEHRYAECALSAVRLLEEIRAMGYKPEETDLLGKWEDVGRNVVADATSKRIEALIEQYLKKIAVDASGWDSLYNDPDDGRYWEITYPDSFWHGGGPPRLTYLSHEQARAKSI